MFCLNSTFSKYRINRAVGSMISMNWFGVIFMMNILGINRVLAFIHLGLAEKIFSPILLNVIIISLNSISLFFIIFNNLGNFNREKLQLYMALAWLVAFSWFAFTMSDQACFIHHFEHHFSRLTQSCYLFYLTNF